MKIVCTAKEFATLVRICEGTRMDSGCSNCIFSSACGVIESNLDEFDGFEDAIDIEVTNDVQ